MADRTVVEGDLKNPRPRLELGRTRLETTKEGKLPSFEEGRAENGTARVKETQVIPPDDHQPTAQRKLIGWLYSFSRKPEGEFFELREGRTKIGRDGKNDIVLQSEKLPGFDKGYLNIHAGRREAGTRREGDTQMDEPSRPGTKTHVATDEHVESAVSAEHCYILHRPQSKYTFLKDCGSTNGTYLNGDDICDEQKRLADGDEIGVGSLKLVIRLVKEALPAPKEETD